MNQELVLTENGLRVTEGRRLVLNLFMHKRTAISHSYLEEELHAKLDRVTIYRTLHSFLEKGIIHKVLDEGGSTKYALGVVGQHHFHRNDHIHFKCETCGDISCINEVAIPEIKLPGNYVAKEIGILIQGICEKCTR